jgi:hypothetical protein
MNYQVYITPPINYHFVTNDPLPLVKDVKHDGQYVTCVACAFFWISLPILPFTWLNCAILFFKIQN